MGRNAIDRSELRVLTCVQAVGIDLDRETITRNFGKLDAEFDCCRTSPILIFGHAIMPKIPRFNIRTFRKDRVDNSHRLTIVLLRAYQLRGIAEEENPVELVGDSANGLAVWSREFDRECETPTQIAAELLQARGFDDGDGGTLIIVARRDWRSWSGSVVRHRTARRCDGDNSDQNKTPSGWRDLVMVHGMFRLDL